MTPFFTTGSVAKLLHVSPSVVARWIDSGRLKGYTLPGTKDRRVIREELARFLHRHEMPPLSAWEAWAASGESPEAFDRRIQEEEDAIRASGATACSYCGKAFTDHPGSGRERRVCNGDMVRI